MNDEAIVNDAARLEGLMPEIARNLFTLESDHPALDMPMGQLRACAILYGGPQTLGALGERLRVSASAVSQLADRLERAGFVERVLEADDRRVRLLQLSARGEGMMRLRREQRRTHAADALRRLCPEIRSALMSNLEALLEASAAVASASRCEDPVGARLNS
jgi:DNA-binding MarR family transcriptional regulator